MYIPTTTLHNGVTMPMLGLGVYKAKEGEEVKQAIKTALEVGYRSIDTATVYENESGVGEAIRKSGIAREELFITTKVWNDDQGYETTLQAFEKSLQRLQMDYVDLYLIHWPIRGKYIDTYRALEKLYEEGKVRAIGVSNFHQHHLEQLLQNCNVKPMVNQVELHPMLAQFELRDFCQNKQIQMEAWSPLMRGGEVFHHPIIQELAEKYGKTPAQIILRWDVQSGIVTIPKSVTPSRIKENFTIFDFALTEDEIKQIDTLDRNLHVGTNPDKYDTM
ncbi:aldo/keto reductase [Bacillus gaemokensis]|uniref:Glyoxal reductase n=1 Tax=Bacillus gaemokensis TaxID=574375 RepID=A0A073KUI3_9BACI|nr:aldo/keto reductase [Bacillus gaemokensis]KEK26033.1 glyoxal reductase [Bacillus gaemokensis]KYG38845.1 glyoxal reductase [Bacillus gaemokensis]